MQHPFFNAGQRRAKMYKTCIRSTSAVIAQLKQVSAEILNQMLFDMLLVKSFEKPLSLLIRKGYVNESTKHIYLYLYVYRYVW